MGKEAENFIRYYEKCRDFLHEKDRNEECTREESQMIRKLDKWLDGGGMQSLSAKLYSMPESRASDFTLYYEYLIESAKDNVLKVIDLMFGISYSVSM